MPDVASAPVPLETLPCTGRIGAGPAGTANLALLLPNDTWTYPACGPCAPHNEAGVYVDRPAA